MKMLVFFLAKCVRNSVKTKLMDRKNQKSTSSAIFGVETAAKSSDFEQNWQKRRGKFELFAWTLSPNCLRLNWTFPLPPKRQLSILLNFFVSINKFVFDFCCLCLFCYNCASTFDFAPKTRGIQHRVISSVWSVLVSLWCGRTVTWLLRYYQTFLAW